MFKNVVYALYGICLVLGGYMGYQTAQSAMSLVMGVITGALVFAGLYLKEKKSLRLGRWIIFAVSLILVGVFGVRLAKTGAFMPSGLMLIISAIVMVFSAMDLKKSGV